MSIAYDDPSRVAVRHVARRYGPFLQTISVREIEVLQLIANGLGNREIARTLYVSEETVKTHVQRLLRKLSATSRAHAVAIAIRDGLIA